jgi:hypothetical protein
MKRLALLVLSVFVAAGAAAAQSSGSAQASSSASAHAGAKAGKTEVKADAGATASQEAKAGQEKGKQEKQGSAKVTGKSSAEGKADAQAGDSSVNLEGGSVVEAALTKSLDARKNKVGDEVVAKVTKDVKSDGKVVLPKKSKLIGRITEVKARSKGESESALGIEFDRAILKDGREVPLHLAIQAVAVAENAVAASMNDAEVMNVSRASGSGSTAAGSRPASSGSSGGGLVGGATSTVNSTVSGATGAVAGVGNTAGATVNSTLGTATDASANANRGNRSLGAIGQLTSHSTGVIGLQGLQLRSNAENDSQGSLLVSNSRNVRLESGTRMLLRAEGSAKKQKGESQ